MEDVDPDDPSQPQVDYYPKAEGVIRLVSYNVGVFSKFPEVYPNSLPQVANMIKEIEADVVGLQELDSVNRRHSTYQLAALGNALKWNYQFGRAMDYEGGAYGNGIVIPKTYGIIDTGHCILPKGDKGEQRSLVLIETDQFVFISTHLDHSSESACLGQIQKLNNYVQGKYYNYEKPVFLVGDMNSTPDSNAINLLETNWLRVSTKASTVVGGSKCIDHIFVYKHAVQVEVVGAATMTRFRAAEVNKTSDHLPIYVDVKLKQ